MAPVDESRARWQEAAEWQPLRRLIEHLLVTWDWATAFAALQLAVKPALDDYLAGALAARLRAAGDHLFAEVLAASGADARWSREWTEALVTTIAGAQPDAAAQPGATAGPAAAAPAAAAPAALAAPWRDEAAAAIAALEAAPCP
jgi:hypothetical protein